MFHQTWILWCLFLAVPFALCSLDIIENNTGVACSQGLWDCTLKDGTPFDFNSFKVTDLSLDVKLCCGGHTCALCMLIHAKVYLDIPREVEGSSGQKDDGGNEETKDNEAETSSITLCYTTPEVMPTCKKVEFIVNQARLLKHTIAQISVVITSDVITYGSRVNVNSPNVPKMTYVQVPSPEDVCNSDINFYVKECNVPTINSRINDDNEVELHFPGSNNSVPVVCVQNEMDGNCQDWDGEPIPLESVTPCTCFQAWHDVKIPVRTRSCPFKNNTNLWKNMTKNCKLSVTMEYIDLYGPILLWNVTAPCRLQGEVWACERLSGITVCTEKNRKQLRVDSWKQNINGLWENVGSFENISLENYPCVMTNMKGIEHQLPPFCFHNINRGRWSLFAVAVMLVLSLTLLMIVFLQNCIKKSVRSWHRGVLVKMGHRAHVLVLSPPDSDEEVSAAVCHLGSLLSSMDFSVTVDQWSRQGQHSLGPLPWCHGHLFSVDSSQCERVVLVLTPKAVERAQTWNSQDSPVNGVQEDPYSDVFKASLFAIQAFKVQDRASERFVLVTFDSLWTDSKICVNKLPQILQGLPLFHLPSQSKALLLDLRVGRTRKQFRGLSWTFL